MRGRIHTALIAGLALGCACTAIAEEDGFSINARIYRIEGTPVYVYGEDATGLNRNAALEARLDSPITVAFEKVHVQEILGFVREIYKVEFRIDENLIAPPNHDATGYATDGMVAYVNLKEVALRQGLAAILYPMGLAFVADDDHIRIRRATDVSHTDAVRQTPPVPLAPGEEWKVLTEGEIRVGHYIVSLSAESPPSLINVEGVESVGNPVFVLANGQAGAINIDGYVTYLAEIPGTEGKYQRHHTPEPVGLSLGLTCNALAESTAECDLDLNYSYVKERRILPGTSLPAGEPLIARATTQQKTEVALGKPVAMLTRLGDRKDDTLLVLVQVSRMPAAVPASSPSVHRYALETTFLQVRGEPNWEWWMRPYDKAYRMYEGAGRVIGPVNVSGFTMEKKIDWAKLGMRQVKEGEVLSNPRVMGPIDHARLIREGVLDVRGNPIDGSGAATPSAQNGGRGVAQHADGTWKSPYEHIDEMYLGITGTPRTFTRADLEGKMLIADISQSYYQEEGHIKPFVKGVAVFGEVKSTPTAGVVSVEQQLLVNDLRLGVQPKSPQPDADFFRVQLRCETEMNDASTSAFLLPIAGDEFLVVLSTVQRVKE